MGVPCQMYYTTEGGRRPGDLARSARPLDAKVQRAADALELLIARAEHVQADLLARAWSYGDPLQEGEAEAVAVMAEVSTARLCEEHLARTAARFRQGQRGVE